MEAALTRELERVTGVRPSTPTYHREYRRTATELARAIAVLASLPAALRVSWAGPTTLAETLVSRVAQALGADWVALAMAPDALDGALPRLVSRRADGKTVKRLPGDIAARIALVVCDGDVAGAGPLPDQLAIEPLRQGDASLGALIAWFDRPVDDGDRALLDALALQTAVALDNAVLYHESERLRTQQERHHQQAERHARRLEQRGAELYRTQRSLVEARARQMLERERTRIARELHDTVAQHLLGIGMQLEWCRPLLDAGEIADRLTAARELARSAVGEIRQAIYELSSFDEGASPDLVDAIADLVDDVRATFVPDARLVVRGTRRALPIPVEHRLLRIVQEAVFNVVRHAGANRVVVRLTFGEDAVRLSVVDDGCGDAERLRALLRGHARQEGGHYGLRSMAERARELGTRLQLRRARGGGVHVLVHVDHRAAPHDGGPVRSGATP